MKTFQTGFYFFGLDQGLSKLIQSVMIDYFMD